MATQEQVQSFIKKIGPIVQKCAKEKGYHIASAVIAQACMESGYGTSNKAQYHNYFGMKYRPNRCPSSSGYFYDKSVDQYDDGALIKITDNWFAFDTMEDGVRGFYEFISIPNYNALRDHEVTTPEEWLQILVNCGYATKYGYVENNCKIINRYNLLEYDNIFHEPEQEIDTEPENDGSDQPLVDFENGNPIKLTTDFYTNGDVIPAWVKQGDTYFRGYCEEGIMIGIDTIGPAIGVVDFDHVIKL